MGTLASVSNRTSCNSPCVDAPTVSSTPLVAVPDLSRQEQAKTLLGAVWRSPDRVHQLAQLGRNGNGFCNIPVTDVSEAVRRARALSDARAEAYFACAEYETPDSRTAANESGA
jgi:hypothetical protein